MSLAFSEIKGLPELLTRAKQAETVNREDAWLASTYVVAGQRIRTMTVDDFVALLQFQSPLLSRRLPNPDELIFFLWILSPENLRFRDSRWLAPFAAWRARRFSKHLAAILDLKAVDRCQREAAVKGERYELPEDSPLAKAIEGAFKYVDLVFMDRPPGLKQNGLDAGLCYLTSWFDAMQSEYPLPTAEVWKMALPVLFARLKAIQFRKIERLPQFNANRDKIMADIAHGLNSKLYTEDDLKEGRVDLETNRLKLN